ncbi:MAG: hypothetical protein PHW95_00155 [Patescibacteria group bacterium]|nr:hypothetical protein [Patescibacteria group bacterium]
MKKPLPVGRQYRRFDNLNQIKAKQLASSFLNWLFEADFIF